MGSLRGPTAASSCSVLRNFQSALDDPKPAQIQAKRGPLVVYFTPKPIGVP